MAEIPPRTNPSSRAYSGAVKGAQVFLKMVTKAVIRPPSRPPIIHGIAFSGLGECERPQVQAEVATTQSRSMPVLLTVPCTVIASPVAIWPWKAFSFRAGFAVRKGLGMVYILCILLLPSIYVHK